MPYRLKVTASQVAALGRVRWSPIGLVDMLNSGGAVLAARLERVAESAGKHDARDGEARTKGAALATLTCRRPGCLVAFCEPPPSRVLLDGVQSEGFHYKDGTGQFTMILSGSAENNATVTFFWEAADEPY